MRTAESVLRSRILKLVDEARSNAVVDFLKDKKFVIGEGISDEASSEDDKHWNPQI